MEESAQTSVAAAPPQLAKPVDSKTEMQKYLKNNLETEGYQTAEFMQYLGGKKRIMLFFISVSSQFFMNSGWRKTGRVVFGRTASCKSFFNKK